MTYRRIDTFTTDKTRVAKLLAQDELTNSAVSYYSPDSNIHTTITKVILSNTSNSTKDFSAWHDPTGVTYDDTTNLYKEISLTKNSAIEFDSDSFAFMNGQGNLAFRASSNSSITITIYGIERQK